MPEQIEHVLNVTPTLPLPEHVEQVFFTVPEPLQDEHVFNSLPLFIYFPQYGQYLLLSFAYQLCPELHLHK